MKNTNKPRFFRMPLTKVAFEPAEPICENCGYHLYAHGSISKLCPEVRPSNWTPEYVGDTASPRTMRVSEFTRRNGLETNFKK